MLNLYKAPKIAHAERLLIKRTIHFTYRVARRIAIGVIGATVVILGIVMLVTPGPGLLVIPVGLAILSLEFAWARLWLRKVRETISNNSFNNRSRRADEYRS